MSATYGKWRSRLSPEAFAKTLISWTVDDWYLDGPCESMRQVRSVIRTYQDEGYLCDQKEVKEILKHAKVLLHQTRTGKS